MIPPVAPSMNSADLHPREMGQLTIEPIDSLYLTEAISYEDKARLALETVLPDLKKEVFSWALQVDPKLISDPETLEREASFLTKLYANVLEMADRNPYGNVLVEFDCDETLVVNGHLSKEARPGFNLGYSLLKAELGDRLRIGAMTTRLQSSLDEELVNPTYFEEVIDSVDSELMISTHAQSLRPGEQALVESTDLGGVVQKLQLIGDLVDPSSDIVDRCVDDRSGRFARQIFDPKLLRIQELAAAHPDDSVILVDDGPWAGIIRDDHPQIRGIHVFDEIQSDIPYRNPLAA